MHVQVCSCVCGHVCDVDVNMLYCGMHAVEGQLDSRRQGWPMQVFGAHLQLKAPGLGPDPVPRSYPGCPGPMFLLWVRHRTVSLED